jgi:hypothetical protein
LNFDFGFGAGFSKRVARNSSEERMRSRWMGGLSESARYSA